MDAATLENLIIHEIRKSSEISRRDLSDRLDIARSTAGRRVDSLIERGMIREKGVESRDTVGRPRRFLELVGDFGAFVGMDFDAQYIHGAVINFAQKIVAKQTVSLPANPDAGTVLRNLRSLGQKLEDRVRPLNVLGVGIAVPGRINRAKRLGVNFADIQNWQNVPLSNGMHLSRERLAIETNARAGALGEYWFGNRRNFENLVSLNIRAGISAAVVSNGKLIIGRNEMAGEIRGWPAWPPKQLPGSGGYQEHWIENLATVRAITSDVEGSSSDEKQAWRTFAKACSEGNSESLGVLKQLARYHGSAIGQIVQLVDPGAVVVNGWFAQLGEIYLNSLKRSVEDSLEGNYFDLPEVSLSKLDDFSGALGAASLAAENTGAIQ